MSTTVKTFKRGLHVPKRKEATIGKPSEAIPPPKQVVIPINQHFGAPNKCLVQAGDKVARGQKIADAAAPGPMTVPVHASISGIVKKIEPRTQSNNIEGICVVIEAESGVPRPDAFMPPLDPFSCTREDALSRIREAGLVGMGGAGFPVHAKLAPQHNKHIDLVIANAAECEAYLTSDACMINEKTDLLIQGIAMVMHIVGVKKGVIGIEDDKSYLIPLLERAIVQCSAGGNSLEGRVTVQPLRTKYPQGGEKMLVTAITGREVPSGGLPMDVGCVVSNAGTLAALAEAFILGKPLIERYLTVSGGACGKPRVIVAPIGALISDLSADFFDIDYNKLKKIIFGGPMMGTAVPFTSIPIQKNTSGIVLMTADETTAEKEGPCVRCGLCMRNCSCRLSPVIMREAVEADELEEARDAGLLDCIECGNCSYICPARIKLVQHFRVGKQRFRIKQAVKKPAAAKS